MKMCQAKTILTTTMAVLLWCSAASATINLPNDALRIRFDAITAFDTTQDPTIDIDKDSPTAGFLLPLDLGEEIILTAFGEVRTIADADDHSNRGSISGELTYKLSNLKLEKTGQAGVVWGPGADPSEATFVSYSVTSKVTAGTFEMYDDGTTATDLVTADYFGAPTSSIPAAASDGTPWLIGEVNPDNTFASIIAIFQRPNTNSDFATINLVLQAVNGIDFTITGGVLLDMFPSLLGESLELNQLGFSGNTAFLGEEVSFDGSLDGTLLDPASFGELLDTDLNPYTRNSSIGAFNGGTFELTMEIPEPGTAGLMAAGCILLTLRPRRR